eukprot:TRINITY_DN38753_c0_g1_i1.p2 TRINITY_DN38753_c0_g1~~TRINITY_DN38753_c0_g1_i1.p2  ORF type:complete len:146 (+),score=46.97 TRINITY_DN38753_c0_g1_i1:84-521(+)
MCIRDRFIAGVGKFFEGNAAQMSHICQSVLGALPDCCLLFCGHEYTVSNLKFAHWLTPEDDAVRAKLAWAEHRRQGLLPTVPSTIGEERRHNPFMREAELESAVRARWLEAGAPGEGGETAMGMMRRLKDVNAHLNNGCEPAKTK